MWKPLNRDSLKAGVHCIFARGVYSCTIETRCHGDIIPLAWAQVFTFSPQIKQCKQQCRIDSVPSFNGETEHSNVHNAHLMRCMITDPSLGLFNIYRDSVLINLREIPLPRCFLFNSFFYLVQCFYLFYSPHNYYNFGRPNCKSNKNTM